VTAVLKRLEEVRAAMKELTRDLNRPRHYFDLNEVNRKVTERVGKVEPDTRLNGSASATS
jgi:hypothetical protein